MLDEGKPIAVFIGVYAFLYASLGKSRVFHFEPRARLVLSGVLALYSSNIVLDDPILGRGPTAENALRMCPSIKVGEELLKCIDTLLCGWWELRSLWLG